jgi:hypothetical protein
MGSVIKMYQQVDKYKDKAGRRKERGDGNRVGSLKRRWEEGRKSREKIGRGWDV